MGWARRHKPATCHPVCFVNGYVVTHTSFAVKSPAFRSDAPRGRVYHAAFNTRPVDTLVNAQDEASIQVFYEARVTFWRFLRDNHQYNH